MTASHRLSSIDMLRGTAAIGVLLFHAFPQGRWAVTGGYLAVDLFFMLSGFVMVLSYEDRLRMGMTLRAFLIGRAIRLWPMLALGALLGIVLHGGHAGMLFLLPNPFSPSLLYPSNPPYWSLLFEVLAYCSFAGFAARLGNVALFALALVSGAALARFALEGSAALVDFGADWRTLPHGLSRLSFAFSLGMLLCRLRLRRQGLQRTDPRAALLPMALIAIMLTVPWHGPHAPVAGLVAIFGIFPALVWFAGRYEIAVPRFAAALGDMSYPLYCIHVPLLALLPAGDLRRLPLCAALLAAALVLDRCYDRPMQRLLRYPPAGRRIRPASA